MTPSPQGTAAKAPRGPRGWLARVCSVLALLALAAFASPLLRARADPIASNLRSFEAVCFDGYVEGVPDCAATFLTVMQESSRLAARAGIPEDPNGCWGEKATVITVWMQIGVNEAPDNKAFVMTLEGVAGGDSSLPYKFPVVWSVTHFGSLRSFEVTDDFWRSLVAELFVTFASDWERRKPETGSGQR